MTLTADPKSIVYHGDCMDFMAQFPDKYFELAIVDPPYGDGGGGRGKVNLVQGSADGSQDTTSGSQPCVRRTVRKVSRTGGSWSVKYQINGGFFNTQDIRHWDVAPDENYFNELFRVSKHQIIWGGNYFPLPVSRNFIVWKKLTISEKFSMAMAEYAWTNIEGNAKIFECAPQGNAKQKRFHPTQKPVSLYSWLLTMYAKPGDKILDTHMGSQSSRIACWREGFDYWGSELDADYFKAGCERFEKEIQQPLLLRA